MATHVNHYTYVIHNDIDGRYYIGSRSTNSDPHSDPYMGSIKDRQLCREMRAGYPWVKYIVQRHSTRPEAAQHERDLIKPHIGNGLCLNKRAHGENRESHSPEARRLISEANSRRILSAETKERIRNSLLGKKMSAEARANMSKAGKGRVLSPAHRAALSESVRRAKAAK